MTKIIGWLVLSSLFLTACVTNGPVVADKDKPTVLESDAYLVGVNDQLAIRVWKNPELSVQVPVRPDGKISVPLIGDVQASGISVQDLASSIENSLQSYVRSPQVTVIVTETRSDTYLRRIRVTGAIIAPQAVEHQQGITVLDVILQAGGLTPFANANRAKLYRKNEEGVMQVYPIRLKDILEKGRLETNYPLVPSDIITVPERAF